MNICYYHDDSDGIMSAAIVGAVHKGCKFIKCQYGKEPDIKIADIKDKDVFVVDFSFEEPVINVLWQQARSLCWIDHHKSAKERLLGIWECNEIDGIRELGKAGCQLAWEWFYPHEDMPKAVAYIADWDTWKFQYGSDTKKFHEAFVAHIENPMEFELKHLLAERNPAMDRLIEKYISDGETLMIAKESRVKGTYEDGRDGVFEGIPCRMMNANHDISDVGDYAIKQGYRLAVIYADRGSKTCCSLRSDGSVDVSTIARSKGGGGHPRAAGFQEDLHKWREHKKNGTQK